MKAGETADETVRVMKMKKKCQASRADLLRSPAFRLVALRLRGHTTAKKKKRKNDFTVARRAQMALLLFFIFLADTSLYHHFVLKYYFLRMLVVSEKISLFFQMKTKVAVQGTTKSVLN